MIWTLAQKELLSNLLTLRLGVTSVFAVGLIVLTSIIGSLDYSQRVEDYEERARRVRADLETATIYAEVRPHVVVPPEPLSIFSRGVDKDGGQVVGVSIDFIGAKKEQAVPEKVKMSVIAETRYWLTWEANEFD